MKEYWDSSALVAAALDARIRDRVSTTEAVTRSHSAAEVFSTLTGSRLGFRVDANDASQVIRDLLTTIEVVNLPLSRVLEALDEARSRGIRGGQVHDYLHAVAAQTANCETIITLNHSDFKGLFSELKIESP